MRPSLLFQRMASSGFIKKILTVRQHQVNHRYFQLVFFRRVVKPCSGGNIESLYWAPRFTCIPTFGDGLPLKSFKATRFGWQHRQSISSRIHSAQPPMTIGIRQPQVLRTAISGFRLSTEAPTINLCLSKFQLVAAHRQHQLGLSAYR